MDTAILQAVGEEVCRTACEQEGHDMADDYGYLPDGSYYIEVRSWNITLTVTDNTLVVTPVVRSDEEYVVTGGMPETLAWTDPIEPMSVARFIVWAAINN